MLFEKSRSIRSVFAKDRALKTQDRLESASHAAAIPQSPPAPLGRSLGTHGETLRSNIRGGLSAQTAIRRMEIAWLFSQSEAITTKLQSNRNQAPFRIVSDDRSPIAYACRIGFASSAATMPFDPCDQEPILEPITKRSRDDRKAITISPISGSISQDRRESGIRYLGECSNTAFETAFSVYPMQPVLRVVARSIFT